MRRGRVGLAGLVLCLSGVVWAHAEEPTAIIACAHKKTGALRAVGAHGECRPSEVELAWSVEGPPGPQGPPGNVPNRDVLRIAELAGDPAFANDLPAGILKPVGCDATLEVSGLGDAPVAVLGMIGTETISRPPRYRILVEGPSSEAWLGSPVVVQFDDEGTNTKFGSVATEVTSVGYAADESMAVVELTHPAAGLAPNRAYRVFQDISVPELFRSILSKVGQPFDFRLEGTYEPVGMAVQYNESDLDFATRLLEDSGVFFFFDADGTLVAGDSNDALDREAGSITFGDGEHGRRLSSFRRGARLDLGSVTVIGFDFQTTVAPIVSTMPSGGGDPEAAFFHESIDSLDGAASRALLELERARQEIEFAHGTSTAPGVRAGRVVTIEAGAGLDGEYVVTGVRHVFARGRDGCLKYGNAFVAQPAEAGFRPSRVTPRPRIPGPQTAIVVGPAGEETSADEYGRVKVRFHWDREGQRDDSASAWIRVAHPAGRNESIPAYTPGLGDEVLVVFEQGDPSRPIIVGSMYNGVDTPPAR
jgi:type VI secretion system secreted protein VgrG